MMPEIEEERWPARLIPVPPAALRREWAPWRRRSAAIGRRGRYLDTTCQLNVGDEVLLLRIIEGRVIELRQGPFVTPSAEFAISGDAAVWRRFLAAAPPPGDHGRPRHALGDKPPVLDEIAERK